MHLFPIKPLIIHVASAQYSFFKLGTIKKVTKNKPAFVVDQIKSNLLCVKTNRYKNITLDI